MIKCDTDNRALVHISRSLDLKAFIISSSNNISLLLMHAQFNADDKPRFPHADVARKF